MAEGGQQTTSASASLTLVEGDDSPRSPSVHMTLKQKNEKEDEKKVSWTEETIDNEFMNKKKSKCCCIYTKPKKFDESSSEDEDDCEHCRGHKKKDYKKQKHPGKTHNPDGGGAGCSGGPATQGEHTDH